MRDLVKGLGEVEEDAVSLFVLIEGPGQVIYCDEELRFVGSVFPESGLKICDDVVDCQVDSSY